MSVKPWIHASRLRTLPLASACVMVGGALAFRSAEAEALTAGRFWIVFASVLIDVFLLQILSNWANDWGDFENGADGPERADRAVASGAISASAMKTAVKGLAVVSFLMGIGAIALALRGTDLLPAAAGILLLGIGAIAAAFKYTAGDNPYGYKGLGDIVVMVFFGWVGVCGSAFLLSHAWDWSWLLPATWSGALSVAVLNLNNMRDHANDLLAGKRTLVVKWGWERAKVYHAVCILGGWLAWWVFALVLEPGMWRGLGWLALINLVQMGHLLRVWRCDEPQSLDPELKKVALSTAVAALFMLLAQTGAA